LGDPKGLLEGDSGGALLPPLRRKVRLKEAGAGSPLGGRKEKKFVRVYNRETNNYYEKYRMRKYSKRSREEKRIV